MQESAFVWVEIVPASQGVQVTVLEVTTRLEPGWHAQFGKVPAPETQPPQLEPVKSGSQMQLFDPATPGTGQDP